MLSVHSKEEKEWQRLSTGFKVVGTTVFGLCALSVVRAVIRRCLSLSNLCWTGLSVLLAIDCHVVSANIKKSIKELTYDNIVATGLQEEGRREMEKIRTQGQQSVWKGMAQGVQSAKGLLSSGLQAVGTPEQQTRLVGIGLGSKVFVDTWILKPLWELVFFTLPSLARQARLL